MSYDVTVGTQEFNYTANMGKFFADFAVHPADLHGEPPYEVAYRISLALTNIPRFEYEALMLAYDNPNGWARSGEQHSSFWTSTWRASQNRMLTRS